MDYLTTHTSLSPIRHGFAPGFVNYKKGCTRLASASDKVYQLLIHGRWFSPASSTTKTGRHNIAESGVRYKNSINQCNYCVYCVNFLSKLADVIATHEKTVIYCILYHYADFSDIITNIYVVSSTNPAQSRCAR